MTTSRDIFLIEVRRAAIRKFLRRDKTPVMILVLAARVGVAFEKGINALQTLRLETVMQWALDAGVFLLWTDGSRGIFWCWK